MATSKNTNVKKFEVALPVKVKGAVVPVGGEVTSEELAAIDAQSKLPQGTTQRTLLETGRIRDTDAPIAPSKAEGVLALDSMANLAQRLGVLTRDGSTYKVGDKSAEGLAEFRASFTPDEIADAIYKAKK